MSPAQRLALEKWDALCLDMVEASAKPEEVLEMFNSSPFASMSEEAAGKKYVELCGDLYDLCDFLDILDNDTDYGGWAKALELVSNGQGAERLYNSARSNALQARVVKKRLDLAADIEGVQEALKMSEGGSEVEIMCVRKLATFYGYEESQA